MAAELWDLSARQRLVLTYPYADEEEVRKRIVELAMLGVRRLVFEGPVELWGLRVLAKGTTSVVVKGEAFRAGVAVKVRRMDANRPSLLAEAERLRLANMVGVGPRLLAASRNFLVWRYVEGLPLEEWALKAEPEELRVVAGKLIDQALALDSAGLVHMELSRLGDHVLVTPDLDVVIFDFETASTSSSKSNVTQILQGLFIRETETAEKFREALGVTKEAALEAARAYKAKRRREALGKLIGALGQRAGTTAEQGNG